MFLIFRLSVNGEKLWQSFHRLEYPAIFEWMDYYRTHSGKNYLVQRKYEYTDHPSIQGMWHPFVNADPTIATANFPVDQLSKPFGLPKSASDHLVELFEQQKLKEKEFTNEDQLESTKQKEQ